MNADVGELRASWVELERRLAGNPDWPHIQAIYLDLVLLVGQIGGAVPAAERGEAAERRGALLAQLKGETRQVGLDIRLASPGALQLGLQAALATAGDLLDLLDV